MTKDQTKKKKKDLGIFYTPAEVVNFIFDVLNIWKDKEDNEKHRWQTRKPQPHFPSVIDSACGEGIFLKTAVTSGFTGYHPKEKTPYVFGVDIDGEVVKRWEEISILQDLFKGKKQKMLNHFHQQDGLLELPEKVFNYKTGGLKEFDAVVGNPPYGGIGIQEITPDLEKSLFNFQIWGAKFQKNPKNTPGNLGIFGATIPNEFKKQIKNFPIEILFIDRFIQLAKAGGWIAIIIPDGILTNSNSHYVREFVSHKTKVEAIISLPRNTFKNVGTSAKTSILFLRKLKKDEKSEESYPVFLASLEKIDKRYLDEIVKSYEKYYNSRENHMNTSNTVQITKDQNKREVAMVRVDKTLKELMEEKPSGRWSPDYWNPKFDEVIKIIERSPYETKALEEFIPQGIEWITYGSTKPRQWSTEGVGVRYIKPGNVSFTGLDYPNLHWTPEGRNLDGPNYRVGKNDLIVNKSGVGTWGRGIVLAKDLGKIVVSQDTMRIRVRNISPYYVAVFLWSKLGHGQQERNFVGVGAPHIDFDELRTIKISVLPEPLQDNIEAEYIKMSAFHDKAMEAKKMGEEKGYKENLETAEKMLKDLIKRTEEVIEGKREDVN